MATEAYSSIFEGILKIQKKSRFIGLAEGMSTEEAGPDLGYTDGLVLLIVESEPDRTVKELAKDLRLERSWMSRIISDLEVRRLIKSFVPEADKRSKKIRLTKKGDEALDRLTVSRRVRAEKVYQELTSSEQSELKDLFKQLADGLKVPRYVVRSGSHLVDSELARVSWGIGVIGDNFFNTGLNVTQLQLLYALANCDGASTASELYQELPFDMSTVSRTLANFEKIDLLEKTISSNDKRSYGVALKSKGLARWKECQANGVEMLKTGLAGISEAKSKRLEALLATATETMPKRARENLAAKIELKQIDESEREKLSKQFKRESKGKAEARADFSVNESYSILFNQHLCGVVDLQRHKDSGQLTHFSFVGAGMNEKECLKVIRNCLGKGNGE